MSLRLENVSSGYHSGVDIVKEVCIEAKKGKVTCIIGPNGAGKSTILKTAFGLLKAREGKVFFENRDVTDASPGERKNLGISYIPQESCSFPQMTVRENLEMACWIHRKIRATVDRNIGEICELFPILLHKRSKKMTYLSGGEHKMLDIAMGLVTKPQTLLVDEPTSGLAPKLITLVYEKLQELREAGFSMLLIDQNIRSAVNISDYVYLIELGKNKLEGPRDYFVQKLDEIIHGALFG